MTWVLLGGLVLVLVSLWDIRRALGLQALPSVTPTYLTVAPVPPPPIESPLAIADRASFRGAERPARFVVVRWPDGLLFYHGCVGAMARDVYTNTHPRPGEEIEMWETGNRRGHKVA